MTELKRHKIAGIVEFLPKKFFDERGYFCEVFKQSALTQQGIDWAWVQDNESYSESTGTVRGLHFQAPPAAQSKLVRVIRGSIFDVAVDIRANSPTYGEWVGVELTESRGNQLLVPTGFAHGFMTLEPHTVVQYKVSDYWSREHEMALRWDDPQLAIDWPCFQCEATLSEKDAEAPFFSAFNTPFVSEGSV